MAFTVSSEVRLRTPVPYNVKYTGPVAKLIGAPVQLSAVAPQVNTSTGDCELSAFTRMAVAAATFAPLITNNAGATLPICAVPVAVAPFAA